VVIMIVPAATRVGTIMQVVLIGQRSCATVMAGMPSW